MNLNVALTILVGTCFVVFAVFRRHAVWFGPARRVLGRRQHTVRLVDSAVFIYVGVVLLLWAALRVALLGS